MTWYEIVIAVAGAFGGIELIKYIGNMIFNRKNNSRIADTQATNAEIEVEKNKAISEAEAKKALEEAHEIERKQWESRIAELHQAQEFSNAQMLKLNEQYADQTKLLRATNQELLALEKSKAAMEVEYLKRVSELELELQKKRCDFLLCPYRKPPTAHTPPKDNRTIDEYFKDMKDAED